MGDDASCAFNESITLQLRGRRSTSTLLRGALQDSVARHEALRTTFSADGLTLLRRRGRRSSSRSWTMSLAGADPTRARGPGARDRSRSEVETPFRSSTGPLLRPRSCGSPSASTWLTFTAHHIVCDGWSMAVMLRDLAALYTARQHGIGRRRYLRRPPFSDVRPRAASFEARPEYAAPSATGSSSSRARCRCWSCPRTGARPPRRRTASVREDLRAGRCARRSG